MDNSDCPKHQTLQQLLYSACTVCPLRLHLQPKVTELVKCSPGVLIGWMAGVSALVSCPVPAESAEAPATLNIADVVN